MFKCRESPVLAAAHARQEGITVNVVGVVDYGTIGELGSREIADIAKAGGGLSRIASTSQLAQTIQMMTRKTVVQTIQQAVNKEVKKFSARVPLKNCLHSSGRRWLRLSMS